jgi:hypothetical protein
MRRTAVAAAAQSGNFQLTSVTLSAIETINADIKG